MGLGIPPLKIKMMLESNPLKSTILVGRLAVCHIFSVCLVMRKRRIVSGFSMCQVCLVCVCLNRVVVWPFEASACSCHIRCRSNSVRMPVVIACQTEHVETQFWTWAREYECTPSLSGGYGLEECWRPLDVVDSTSRFASEAWNPDSAPCLSELHELRA